jgi:nucleotide-binding universal stress UspA family protein
MYGKILVCVDGSACSLTAARVAALIARHCGSEVIALTVYQPSVGPEDVGMWPIEIVPARIDDCARDEKDIIALQIAPVFADLAAPHRLLQERGDPVKCILMAAEREQPDLIVVGSRGLRGVKEILLGSVSCAVMKHATCPVLVVRGDHVSGHRAFEEIVLSSDGSETAQKAAHAAIVLAQKFATALTVLYVSSDLSSSLTPGVVEALHEEEALVGERIAGLDASGSLNAMRTSVSSMAKPAGVFCSYVQKAGEPRDVIVRYAETNGTDLIVIGSRGLGGLGKLLFGSVSSYVAHHAPCPVLIVR